MRRVSLGLAHKVSLILFATLARCQIGIVPLDSYIQADGVALLAGLI